VTNLTRPSVSTLFIFYFSECNLAIKEENELLKEQELLRMEFIERLEKKQEQLETEVSQVTKAKFGSWHSTRNKTTS